MTTSSSKARMVGEQVVDLKKNTAHAKRVNDRLRRRVKRLERAKSERDIKSGSFYCAIRAIRK